MYTVPNKYLQIIIILLLVFFNIYLKVLDFNISFTFKINLKFSNHFYILEQFNH